MTAEDGETITEAETLISFSFMAQDDDIVELDESYAVTLDNYIVS